MSSHNSQFFENFDSNFQSTSDGPARRLWRKAEQRADRVAAAAVGLYAHRRLLGRPFAVSRSMSARRRTGSYRREQAARPGAPGLSSQLSAHTDDKCELRD